MKPEMKWMEAVSTYFAALGILIGTWTGVILVVPVSVRFAVAVGAAFGCAFMLISGSFVLFSRIPR